MINIYTAKDTWCPGKVNICVTVCNMANYCCWCSYAKRFQMLLEFGIKIIYDSPLHKFFNYEKKKCWRYDTSKNGGDFFDTLYLTKTRLGRKEI